jgi:hypothetical protein
MLSSVSSPLSPSASPSASPLGFSLTSTTAKYLAKILQPEEWSQSAKTHFPGTSNFQITILARYPELGCEL